MTQAEVRESIISGNTVYEDRIAPIARARNKQEATKGKASADLGGVPAAFLVGRMTPQGQCVEMLDYFTDPKPFYRRLCDEVSRLAVKQRWIKCAR